MIGPVTQLVMRRPTLGELYDPRRNGYGPLRVALALTIIICHSLPLAGRDAPTVLGAVLVPVVDMFFIVSGFLVLASWERRPHVVAFLLARSARILPGLWVCLGLTAFVIAPIGLVLAGQDPARLFSGAHDAVAYIVANATSHVVFFDIAGTPDGVPTPGAWNGSIWTLPWELLCYLGLAVLGATGMLRGRRALLVLTIAVGGLAVVFTAVEALAAQWYLATSLRFGLAFLLGACTWAWRDRIRLSVPIALLALVVAGLGAVSPVLQVVATPAWCYLLHGLAATMRHPRWQLRRDLAYGFFLYGYPVEQLLVLAGVGLGQPVVLASLAIAVTAPLAVASSVLVEVPAQRLVRRRSVKRAASARVQPPVVAGDRRGHA